MALISNTILTLETSLEKGAMNSRLEVSPHTSRLRKKSIKAVITSDRRERGNLIMFEFIMD